LNRLALRHGAESAEDFLEQTPARYRSLVDHVLVGNRLDVVAGLSGFPLMSLEANCLRQTSEGTYLGDIRLSRTSRFGHMLQPHVGRVCALCIKEDLSTRGGPEECRPYRRAWWDISVFDACVDHAVPLISSCPSCKRLADRTWLSPRFCPCGYDIAEYEPEALQHYELVGEAHLALSRATVRETSDSFLGQLTVSEAFIAIMNIGRAKIYGKLPPPFEGMTQLQRIALKTAGLGVLSNWPEGFQDLLETLSRGSDGGKIGPKKMFGRALYIWLYQDSSAQFEPLRDILRNFYLSRWPATPQLAIFKKKVATSDYVTLGSAAAELGISLQRMGTLARSHGCIEPGRLTRAIPIRRSDVARIQTIISTSISREEAREELGVTPGAMKRLVSENIISSESYARRMLDSGEVRTLVSRLVGDAPVFEVAPKGALGLRFAARVSGRSIPRLIRAIQDGALRPVGVLRREKGLPSILISVSEARAIVDPVDPALLGKAKAAKAAGVTQHALYPLMVAGYLKRVRSKGPDGRMLHYYPAESMEAFRKHYVTLWNIATALGYGNKTEYIRQKLDALVRPVLEAKNVVLYEREAARRALASGAFGI
jgi:hypothetical protein